MTHEVRFRMPENLNIDDVISNAGHSFYGKNLNKNKVIFILDALVKSRAQHRGQLEFEDAGLETSFVPLSSELLELVVYDYAHHLDFLLANNILITDGHFEIGKKCRGYCFAEKYRGQRLKEVVVSDYNLRKGINRGKLENDKKAKVLTRGYSYLTQWWDEGKLEIDKDLASEWIRENEKERLAEIEVDESIVDKEKAIKNAIDTTEDYLYSVSAINAYKHRYSFSGEGHRFYNPITNLKRDLRSYLTYDGMPLVDIDLKNCQPFLSINLFKLAFWEKSSSSSCHELRLRDISKEIHDRIESNSFFTHIITFLKMAGNLVNRDFAFKNYISLVEQGIIYEFIEAHFTPEFPERFGDRSKVKREVLRILYLQIGRAYEKNATDFYAPSRKFQQIFPDVNLVFDFIKVIEENLLPILLQRIESFLMLDVVCKAISKDHPKLPLFTIHDNIITTKGNEAIVREIMTQKIEAWMGHKPMVECTDLIPLKIPSVEVWRPVKDYEEYYEVSDYGNVKGLERRVTLSSGTRLVKGRRLCPRVNNCGYLEVRLSKDGVTSTKFVHSLIAQAFITKPDTNLEVNHKDGNKLNNAISNLEWVTHKANMKHAASMGLCKKIKQSPLINMYTTTQVA